MKNVEGDECLCFTDDRFDQVLDRTWYPTSDAVAAGITENNTRAPERARSRSQLIHQHEAFQKFEIAVTSHNSTQMIAPHLPPRR